MVLFKYPSWKFRGFWQAKLDHGSQVSMEPIPPDVAYKYRASIK